MPKNKRRNAPFWTRVGSAFANGYGDEGKLATATSRVVTVVAVAALTVLSLIALPFAGLGKLKSRLLPAKTNNQTPRA